jgi:hypothetical protein
MKELLKKYLETQRAIFEFFDLPSGTYGEIDIRTEVKWKHSDDEVSWLEGEDDEEYSNDIIGDTLSVGDYTLIYVDNGCGDHYYQIFYNLNKIENE